MFGSTSMFSTRASKKTFAVFAGLALASQANAHLFIQYPAAPMEGPIKDPLEADGNNFPCHGAKIQSGGGIKMTAGGDQLLQFDDGNGANTAVHGGGSCQLSLYYGDDSEAKKDPKNWHVIHSIEGGCPTNAEGNLQTSIQCTDPGADGVNCLNSYNFTIPNGVKPGHATFAWTWFNTIGNREMYMNCVNAQIEGGDSSEMSDFPSLFVANLAGGSLPQCSTTESESYKFPHPGKYVTSNTKGSPYKLSLVSGGSCAADGASSGGSGTGGEASGGGAAPSYGASPSTSGSPGKPSGQPPIGASASAGSGQVTVTTMQTLSSGGAAATSAPAPSAYSAAPSAEAPAPYASGSASNSSGSGSCPAGAQPCSNDGEVVCMGTQFGLCNAGCAVAQPMAAGTTCTNGKIAKRDHVRRHVRHFA